MSRSPGTILCRAPLAALLLLAAGPWLAAASPEPSCRTLSPGQTLKLSLPSQTPAWLLELDQHGIDVEIRAVDAAGRVVWASDSPRDRQGEEVALVAAEEIAAGLALELFARERGAPAGEVCWRFEAVPAERLVFEQERSAAGKHYARGDREGRRAARDGLERALAVFPATQNPRDRGRLLYDLAVLSRLLDDSKAALDWGQRALAELTTAGDGSFGAAAANELGLVYLLQGELDAARHHFNEARATAEANGDRFHLAISGQNLCLIEAQSGALRAALPCFEHTVAELAAVGTPALEASAWVNLGRCLDLLGEPIRAGHAYSTALAFQRSLEDLLGEARTLNNLGLLEQELGRYETAHAHYALALERFETLGESRWQARVHNNLGLLHLRLGDRRDAQAYWWRALPLWREVGDPSGEAATELNLGQSALDAGEPNTALPAFERALALERRAGQRGGAALALAAVARAEAALGRGVPARRHFEQALAELEQVGDLAGQADVHLGLGELALAEGELDAAAASFGQVSALAESLESPVRDLQAALGEARLARLRGQLELAGGRLLPALDRLERTRLAVLGVEAKTRYAGLSSELFELAIDLAFERGDLARALALVERSRARAFVELLAQARIEITSGGNPDLATRHRDLETRLAAKLARLAAGAAAATFEAEVQELSTELDRLEARLRAEKASAFLNTQPVPPSPAEIARLLDADTTLLVYTLGAQRSLLFVVRAGTLEAHVLPPRREIEPLVNRLRVALADPNPAERAAEHTAAGELASVLLGPAGRHLSAPRLWLMSDGALAALPWAALPSPLTGLPLANEHALSWLPSLSSLAALRERSARLAPATGVLAGLIDPVFSADDPRLGRPAARGSSHFERLPGTTREWQRLEPLAPPGPRLLLTGFEASREALLQNRLAGFRVLHLATHGVFSAERPWASGLALSRFAANGEETAGFLPLREVYGLELEAELVVLSGCDSGLGEPISGEGLAGLARGFLFAGARSVVASLWPVDDQATARFMEHFYRALWHEGVSPAGALALAQRRTAAERRYRDPAYWAGWVLVGDGGGERAPVRLLTSSPH